MLVVGLLLGVMPAQAATVERDGENASAIRDLTVDGVVYDVVFCSASTSETYGNPPAFTFPSLGEAEVAARAVAGALSAEGDIRTVGTTGDPATPFESTVRMAETPEDIAAAQRLRYLAFSMVMVIALYFAMGVVVAIALPQGPGGATAMTAILGLFSLASLPIAFMFMMQRLHDMNASGWWSLLMFVPIANALMGLVLIFAPGTKGDNRFGLQPKPNHVGVYLAGLALPVFIVAVVAAVAVPAYNDYVARAQAAAEMAQ